MWKEGAIRVNSSWIHYWIKVFDEPSRFIKDLDPVVNPTGSRSLMSLPGSELTVAASAN